MIHLFSFTSKCIDCVRRGHYAHIFDWLLSFLCSKYLISTPKFHQNVHLNFTLSQNIRLKLWKYRHCTAVIFLTFKNMSYYQSNYYLWIQFLKCLIHKNIACLNLMHQENRISIENGVKWEYIKTKCYSLSVFLLINLGWGMKIGERTVRSELDWNFQCRRDKTWNYCKWHIFFVSTKSLRS